MIRFFCRTLRPWASVLALAALTGSFVSSVRADGDREVITAEEIEQQKPATLMELLNRLVGLGSSGNQLSLRGVPSVALYVDGFPRGGNVVEVDKIKPQDVARIEILRGAASSRYGAEALGGAVIVTTKQGASRWGVDVVQGYNSLDSRYSRAIASGSHGDAGLRLSFEDGLTNKVFITDPHNNPFPSLAQTQDAFQTKREGNAKGSYRRDWLNTGVEVNYLEQTYNYGRPNAFNEYTTVRSKLMAEAAFGDLKLSSNLLYQDYSVDVFRDAGGLDAAGLAPFLRGLETTRTVNLETQAGYRDFNLGLVYGNEREEIDRRPDGSGRRIFRLQDTVDRIGVFAGYGFNFWTDWRFDLGGRYDLYNYSDISVFSSGRLTHEPETTKKAFNPKASLSWKALPWLSLRTSAATGFIPPAPSTLYFRQEQPSYRIVANPGLKPEESLTVDFGLEGSYRDRTKFGLTFFYTRWTDKVEMLTIAGTPAIQTYKNLGESESKGVEFSLNQRITDDLNASLNYTLNFTKITDALDPEVIGNQLPFQPRHRLNAVLDYRGPWSTSARANLHYESEQFMDFRNIVRDEQGITWLNGDYAILDLLFTKKFRWSGTGLDLTFAVSNLFDSRYQKNFFHQDPGRVFRGELAVKF